MPKKNNITITCPCCKKKVEKKKLTQVGSRLPFTGFMLIKGGDYLDSLMTVVSKYPSFYQCACDDCIDTQRAILANPKLQHYSFQHPMDAAAPFLAYFDRGFTCKNCKDKTVFSKEEQQHWYEQLLFVVYSKPIACKKCRKEIRDGKSLNTELSDLLKDGEPKENSKLLRIAGIYKEMGKDDKVKKYLTAAKNSKNDT